ncbi:KOW motif-containing protein [Rhizobium sp. VS19-DR104.2]|uniref:transcription termination/antitermination protein NusG n=1 Tax=unclassified Rhizobium TaxID=2613769 RepID=UPI001CC428FA|nr:MULTISPECIES: transcription termination/antitermination NusG family protein [unclassified Rhizobium]MBZ5760265.1 KOW motif-containing protein [Rhizobium sp. VS19-DR96]MBZ5766891.1 KOW motif-containing protein [Rhizobium sp. VS19-DR129.2]MBZ5773116.1 KOW motif-containing protein [Rhizobium sp. VS19-DRK62.2]MBZ5784100.1 KOW motif-containing protein [Rhizobium sp. VS19-DR121]MBZ5802460.1 KOW motif-containing protein [Rhizobium sp. VS19-DR181]
MTMQHKRGEFQGGVVGGDRGLARLNKASKLHAMRISHLSMASKRVTDRITRDEPHLKAAWYCLQVRVGSEGTVEKVLLNADVETLIVRSGEEKIVNRGRVRTVSGRVVIAGYILIRCLPLPQAMMGLLAVEHVIGIVGGAVKPYRADDNSIERFKAMALEGKYDHGGNFDHDFHLQEVVKVTDGPFAGFPGTVIAIDDERGRVRVEVGIFGRPTPVELVLAQIEKI